MLIRDVILPGFDAEMANTRKMLEKVPEDDAGYKPHAKSMELMRLASHVAEMPGWAATTLKMEVLNLDAGMKPFCATTRAELLEHFDKNLAEARALIASASDQDLTKTWTLTFAGSPVFSMPRFRVLGESVLGHMSHHRAQLQVYLRLKGVEVPGMYGPSADEMKFWEGGAGA